MTIKRKINHGTIQNVCHLHNAIFYPPVSHFVNFTISHLLLLTKDKKPWNERKEDFLYIWLPHRITLY